MSNEQTASRRLPFDKFDPFRDELDALLEQWAGDAMMEIDQMLHRARRKIGCSTGQHARYIRERIERWGK